MGSFDREAADGPQSETLLPPIIVELASIICTGPREMFWVPRAAERRKVQWKGFPVQRKGPPVQWKAAAGAAESSSSQQRREKRN